MFGVFITSLARKGGASSACKASVLSPTVSQDARAAAFLKSPADLLSRRAHLRLAARVVIVRVALGVIYALAFAWAVLFLLSLTA